jgi:hypothetical protein
VEKHRRCRHLVTAFGCALVVLLAGCGVTTAGGAGGTSSATNPASATASASASAATATATASGATAGVVTLAIAASQYSAADPIVVTIRNGGATIFAEQHNTSCSLILLERLVNGAWQPVYPCINGFPHPTVGQVAAGSAVVVQIVPVVTGDAEATGGTRWQAGTYRATLTYTTSQTASFNQGTTIYSATFAVS